jgi:hypothetical protein
MISGFRKIDLLFLSLIPLLAFLLNGCIDTPKEPVFPNWDVEFNIPITGRTYKLSDIIDPGSNPNLTIGDKNGNDSLYVFIITDLHDTSPIVDKILIPPLLPENLQISGSGKGSNDLIFNRNSKLFRLDTAVFKSGFLYINLINQNLSFPINYTIKAPGFKKADNSMLLIKGYLAPEQRKDTTINLFGYTYTQLTKYAFNTDSTQRGDGILFRGEATSDGNEDVQLLSQISNSSITLSRLVGKIVKINVGYTEQEFYDLFGKDTKQFGNKIKFKSTKVIVNAVTKGEIKNLKVIVDSLSVIGSNKISDGNYGPSYNLEINRNKYYMDSLVAAKTITRTYDENNTNILDFMQNFPDLIKVKSNFQIDNISQYTSGTLSDKDSLEVRLNITTPGIISIAGAGYKDTSEIEISDKDREDILKGRGAKLTLEVENHIPLGLLAKCTFTDKNYNPLFTLRNSNNNYIDEFEIVPSAVDNNGIPLQSTTSKISCVLNADEFTKFKIAAYVFIEITLRSTGSTSSDFGPFVQIRANDFVKFKVYGNVIYNLDPEND